VDAGEVREAGVGDLHVPSAYVQRVDAGEVRETSIRNLRAPAQVYLLHAI